MMIYIFIQFKANCKLCLCVVVNTVDWIITNTYSER